MGEFACPVVLIGKVEKHPNADTLSITEVDGCPVIFKTGDFQEGGTAVYVPVESVVKQDSPAGKLMPWLQYKANGTSRIKAARLRGIFSMGVLVPYEALYTNEKFALGHDYASKLGIEKYVEPEPGANTRGQDECAPPGVDIPVYDLESFRKYKGLFKEKEFVAVTEKIHGCNARFAFIEGQLHVGSHNRWKRRPDPTLEYPKSDVWWRYALEAGLEARLNNPEVADRYCFFGEVYGQVQDLKYGVATGVKCVMFDVLNMKTHKWLDYPEFLAVCSALGLEWAPCLFNGQLDEAKVFELAEGLSELGDGACIREGVVVRPLLERNDPRHGRVCYKLHGQGYLLRKGGTERH